jgi:AbrB family looped-hinge helix DNA binding protein
MTKMHATLTERGQISIPSKIRRRANLKPGDHLRWEMISDREFRVVVADRPQAQGAYAAIGYIKRLNPHETRSTDEIMRELRDGDRDE